MKTMNIKFANSGLNVFGRKKKKADPNPNRKPEAKKPYGFYRGQAGLSLEEFARLKHTTTTSAKPAHNEYLRRRARAEASSQSKLSGYSALVR